MPGRCEESLTKGTSSLILSSELVSYAGSRFYESAHVNRDGLTLISIARAFSNDNKQLSQVKPAAADEIIDGVRVSELNDT